MPSACPHKDPSVHPASPERIRGIKNFLVAHLGSGDDHRKIITWHIGELPSATGALVYLFADAVRMIFRILRRRVN